MRTGCSRGTFRLRIGNSSSGGRCARGRRAIFAGFVAGEELTAIAATAERFGSRPSELLAIADPVLALMVDLAAAARLNKAAEETPEPGVRRINL